MTVACVPVAAPPLRTMAKRTPPLAASAITAYVYINHPSSKIQNTTVKITTIIMAVSSRLWPRWRRDRVCDGRIIRQYKDLMETCRRKIGAAGNTTLNAVPGITGVTRYPTSTWLSAKTGASGSPPTAEKVIEVSPKGVQLAPPLVGSIPMQTRTPVFAVEAP